MDDRSLDRRRFVGIVAGGIVTSCLPGCATLAAIAVRSPGGEVRLRLSDHPELTATGGSLRIRTEETGELFYVVRQGDGTYLGLSPICTHQGCTVQISGQFLECPCHGSMYTRDGLVVRGPAELPLQVLPTRVDEIGVLIMSTRAS